MAHVRVASCVPVIWVGDSATDVSCDTQVCEVSPGLSDSRGRNGWKPTMGPPDRGARGAMAPSLLRGLPQCGVRRRSVRRAVGRSRLDFTRRAVRQHGRRRGRHASEYGVEVRADSDHPESAEFGSPDGAPEHAGAGQDGEDPLADRPRTEHMPSTQHPRLGDATLRGSASAQAPASTNAASGRAPAPAGTPDGFTPPDPPRRMARCPRRQRMKHPRGGTGAGIARVGVDRPRPEPRGEPARPTPAGIPGSTPPPPLTQALSALPCAGSAAVAQGQSTPLVLFARPSGNRWDCTVQIRGKLRAQRPCQSRAKPGSPGRCRGQTDGAFAAFGGMVKGWSRPRTLRGPRKRWRQEGWGREFDSRRRHQIRGHRSPGTGASRQHPGGGAGKESG